MTFWKNIAQILETVYDSDNKVHSKFNNKGMFHANSSLNFQSSIYSCSYCNGTDRIYLCQKFLALSTQDRLKFVRTNNMCQNRLGNKHLTENCLSHSICFTCNRKHHLLLHFTNSQVLQNTQLSHDHKKRSTSFWKLKRKTQQLTSKFTLPVKS